MHSRAVVGRVRLWCVVSGASPNPAHPRPARRYQTFTGELYGGGGGGYGSPSNLDFDHPDVNVQDDPRFQDFNLDYYVQLVGSRVLFGGRARRSLSPVSCFALKVVNASKDQAEHMRTNHIMWAMGSDFNYMNADSWYKNIDKLIHHVNNNESLGINLMYSTPR